MKKTMAFALVFALLAGAAAPGYCGDQTRKLSRGVSNIFTFPCEIPYQIGRTNEQNGLTAAMSYGVLSGIFMACYRALVGVYEVATFPIPIPGAFEPILCDPEFFFESSI